MFKQATIKACFLSWHFRTPLMACIPNEMASYYLNGFSYTFVMHINPLSRVRRALFDLRTRNRVVIIKPIVIIFQYGFTGNNECLYMSVKKGAITFMF